MRDYSLLRGRIKEKLKNEYVLAERLNCSKATLSKKLNDEVDFTQSEIKERRWDGNNNFHFNTIYNSIKYDLHGRQESRKS